MNKAAAKKIRKPKVLVVDDDFEMREFLTIALSDQGYEVTGAVDGKDAVDKTFQNHFDLIITDLQMPNFGGLDLLSYVNRFFPLTPVIMMTGIGEPSSLKEANRRGVFAYFTKPFNMQEVNDAVKKALYKKEGP